MHVLPVIDVRDGAVVRAVGGDRARYEALESDLCATGDPLPLAFALRERFECREVYVADLDAIAGAEPNLELVKSLVEIEVLPWVDAGVRDAADALRLRQAGAAVVVGSETVDGPAAWERVVKVVDPRRLAFSLDVRRGQALARHWDSTDPRTVAKHALAAAEQVGADSPARLFVIDLDRVGSCEGVGDDRLLEHLVRAFPGIAIYAGGGVRGVNDVRALDELGVAGVLVSTAIHAGRLQPGRQS
jgi:phosphoribosylformimino-5-aminoimidazole carboxamide ribotide isomerase